MPNRMKVTSSIALKLMLYNSCIISYRWGEDANTQFRISGCIVAVSSYFILHSPLRAPTHSHFSITQVSTVSPFNPSDIWQRISKHKTVPLSRVSWSCSELCVCECFCTSSFLFFILFQSHRKRLCKAGSDFIFFFARVSGGWCCDILSEYCLMRKREE